MSISEATALVINLFRATDDNLSVIMAGDRVRKVGSSAVGIVEFIGDSPYWGETEQRAYVLFYEGDKLASSDYLLSEEIELVN